MREVFEKRMQERQEFLDHYFVFRDGPPIGFNPKHGRGLLAEMRATSDEVTERRRLEGAPPETVVASHPPRPALDLPAAHSGVASTQPPTPAQPPNIQVAPAARTLDRVEH